MDTENESLESMAKAEPLPADFMKKLQELKRRRVTAQEVARDQMMEFLRSL